MTAAAAVLWAVLGAERLIIDTHVHVTMSGAATPIFRGEPGSGVLTASTRTQAINQIDGDQLIRAGVGAVLAAVWPPLRLRPGRTELDEALHQLAGLRDFTMRQPLFAVALGAERARAVAKSGRVALIPAVEGGEGIHQVGDVDRLYAAGARSVQLMHFSNNALGGAANQAAYNLLGVTGAAHEPQGLTDLGRAVVRRMLALGMLVDLAHASDATSRDALQISEELGVPLINSHSGARALLDIERNLPDALARRIAGGGGLIGVTVYDRIVKDVPEDARWPGYAPGSCDDVVAHWRHFAQAVPPAQLALGSDLNGMITRPRPGGGCPEGVRNTGDLPALFEALERHGVPGEALDGMGERLFEVWATLEAKASASARAEALRADPRSASTFDVAL